MGRMKKFFKKKKSLAKVVFFILILPALASVIVPAVTRADMFAKIDRALYGSVKFAEGWGIYYSTVLARTIHTHGLLFWIALIMFFWGMWSKIVPSRYDSLYLEPANYIGNFGIWIVYFGILFYLIGTPYKNPLNPTRNIVYLSDALSNNLALLLNGNNEPTMQDYISKQIKKLSVPQYAGMDYISPKVRQELASYEEKCSPYIPANGVPASKSKLKAAQIAFELGPGLMPIIGPIPPLVYAVGLKTVSCRTYQEKVYRDVMNSFREKISKLARERGWGQDFISMVKQKITIDGARSIYERLGCVPHGLGAILSKIASSNMACADINITPQQAFMAGLLIHSPVEANLYEKIRLDLAEGRNTSAVVGIGKKVWSWITTAVKGVFGVLTVAKLQFLIRTVLPFAIQVAYMVNALIFGFLVMFIPFVLTLALQTERSITMIIRYIFLMLWAKSWIIPISLFSNFYVNYMDKGIGSLTGPLALVILLLLTPVLMGIILLEGSSVIGKLDVGIDKMLTISAGFVGAMSTQLGGWLSSKLPFFRRGGGDEGPPGPTSIISGGPGGGGGVDIGGGEPPIIAE